MTHDITDIVSKIDVQLRQLKKMNSDLRRDMSNQDKIIKKLKSDLENTKKELAIIKSKAVMKK